MVDINLTDPQSNQILVYNELLKQFENTDLTPSIIKDFSYVESAMGIGNGVQIYNDNVSGILRFKSLTGSNGINVKNNGLTIDIEFNGDATTLSGLGREGFLQVSNHLNDVDPVQARANLNVMSVNESQDSFLLANASNIPDNDNTYDLGSNGNRYANMFAVTFHGNATSASMAYKLHRNDASDGQILVWRNSKNNWVAENPLVNSLGGLSDVDLTGLRHETLLVYNGVRNKWEPVPTSIFSGGEDGGGSIGQIENIGDGVGIHSSTLGNTVMLRSISAGNDKVHIDTNFQGNEIVVSVDVPLTTDDLPEGATNRYYRTVHFLRDMERISIQDLAFVDKDVAPTANQAPVWNGTEWEWRNVSVDLGSTDNLQEGSSNLYFTDARTRQSIAGYIADGHILLRNLGDTSFSNPQHNDSLVFNSNTGMWVSRKTNLLELGDVAIPSLLDGQGLVWRSGRFVAGNIPEALEDLTESSNSLHFNSTSFDSFFNEKTTADFANRQDPNYLFLNPTNLETMLGAVSISDLGDVDATGIADGGILAWDSSRSEFVPISQDNLTVTVSMSIADLTDVDENSINNIADGQLLAFDSTSQMFRATNPFKNIIDADDVESSGLQEGYGIVWDGSIFKPKNIVTLDDAFDEDDLIVFNGNRFVPLNRNSLIESIDSISDVSILNIREGDILIYNSTLSRFENKTNSISLMTDVDLSGISNNDVLTYNADTQTFVASRISTSLSGLNDVNVDAIQNGQGIIWNGSSFVPTNMPNLSGGNAYDLVYTDNSGNISLGDFDTANNIRTTNKVTNSVIGWNGIDLEYKPFRFSELGDVVISDIANIQYGIRGSVDINGEYNFTLEPISVSSTTRDLEDVSTDEPEDGDVLTYDAIRGTYVPTKPRAVGGGSYTSIREHVSTQNQISFNAPNTGTVMVWANGILLPSSSYTLTDDSVVLNTPRNANDNIRIMIIQDPENINPEVSGMVGIVEEHEFEIEFEMLPHGIVNSLDSDNIMVWVNGVLYPSSSYTTNVAENRIIFKEPLEENANITVLEITLP